MVSSQIILDVFFSKTFNLVNQRLNQQLEVKSLFLNFQFLLNLNLKLTQI